MNAGSFPPWQGLFVPLSLWAWLCFWLAPACARFPNRRERARGLFRDPSLYGAVGFLILLLLQTWNSGRIPVPDFQGGWSYLETRHPGLPWSFTEEDSLEMIRWFVPVFSVFLIFRHARPFLIPAGLVNFILLNTSLNAALALTHQFARWDLMYDFWGKGKVWGIARNAGKDTYGSFGYPNHAATFFILTFSFALGLFLRELLRGRGERRASRILLFASAAVLFFFTAQFSASRAGILGVWMVLLLTLLYLVVMGWPRAHPVQRLYAVFGVGLTLICLVIGFRIAAQPEHLKEFAAATQNLDPGKEIGARWFQVQSAWDIWKDHPWFGTGGWGYKYLAAYYIDPSMWGALGRGKANVHNDFFQFLCEFGLVGMSFLILVFLPSVSQTLRSFRRPAHEDESYWGDPLRVALGAGLLLMIGHSMIDLPFRSPAVFAHGALFLAWISATDDAASVWHPRLDWKRLTPARFRTHL